MTKYCKYPAVVLTALLALASCAKEGVTVSRGESDGTMTFTAYAEAAATKTSLGEGNCIVWSSSDAITVFSGTGTAGTEFTVSSVSDEGKVATFTGLSHETSNGYYYAISPASSEARLVSTSGTVNASIPTVQTGVEGSFPVDAALSVARVDTEAEDADNILHFKNVGALLCFTVPGNYLNRVKIESRDGEVAMTGPANIKYGDGNPSVSRTSSSKNYVEVTFPQGTIGKRFYAVVYPGEYSKGFVLTFYNSGNSFNSYTSTKALSLKRNDNILLADKNWGVSDDRSSSTSGTELIAPEISSGGQVSPTSASITFSCGSGKRDVYKYYLRDANSMGEGTLVGSENTGSSDYSSRTHTFTGLTTGASYDLGVSASCTDSSFGDSPITWFEDVTINASVSGMGLIIDSAASSYYNFTVNYTVSGLSDTGAEHGLVFSYDNPAPTCGSEGAEGKLPGPTFPSVGTVSLTQCVPNACLRPGVKCYVRAYCFDGSSGNYVYSPVSELTLESQPGGLSISKTEKSSPDASVSLFSFRAGGKFNGFCAVADCSSSSKVRFGVNNANQGTTSAISMASQQESSGALVLVNGQIFGTQGNIGLAYTGGSLKYNNSSDDGISACRGYGNDYSGWQPVTRAILGVDASGTPGAYWCSLIDGSPYFFGRPIPAGTAGNNVYPQVTAASGPGPKIGWSPSEALSTGPMLLYDGKVCVSEDKISTGVYYTNYELWATTAGNIYGSSRQRSAIGYDGSGKMYLVVVTSNVTLTDLALILKGLGCTYAMNLDGGNSSQMYVKGEGELTGNSRSVKSTAGFFLR